MRSGAWENTLRRLALFVYLDNTTKMTSHPVIQYGIIVLSVSKMPIFRNRSDIFNVLFPHDKQTFVFFLVISVFLKKRAISYSKTRCFEGVFFT